jgi:hypothetical protein
MPVERYQVGRSYTKRHYTKADSADPEAMLTVMDEMAAGGPYTVERRLADAEQRAMAHLRGEGKPLDPRSPPYGDPAWLRENERRSLDWYAINILNAVRILRKQIEHGDMKAAVDFALDLGVLATEAKIVQERLGGSERGGEGFKLSDRQHEKETRDKDYIERAIKEWSKPGRQRWGASRIAPLIEPDPTKQRTCRRIIGSAKPK